MRTSLLGRKVAIAFAMAVAVLDAARLVVSPFMGADRNLVVAVLAGGALLQFVVLLSIVIAMRRDMADRVASAERMRRQLSFTGAIVAHLGEGVYALDRDGRLTFMNPAAQAMLGWKEADLLGSDVHGAIHFQTLGGTAVPISECPVLGVLESGEKVRTTGGAFTRRDGTVFPAEYVSSPFRRDGR